MVLSLQLLIQLVIQMDKNQNFDSAYNRLQELYAILQNNELSIEELTSSVKESAQLIKYCKEKLRVVKNEMNQIFED